MDIEVRRDRKRGCGWRKVGGLYLVASGLSAPCGRLPIPLGVCPTCHAGIKFTRGWAWIDADAIAADSHCLNDPACGPCPLARHLGRAGLLWIGEQFYHRPADWTREAVTMGISRRIGAVPKDFKVGETWVLVAHRKAIRVSATEYAAGIFHAFKPTAIEYVVRGDESDAELQAIRERGITPIRVERLEEQPTLSEMPAMGGVQ